MSAFRRAQAAYDSRMPVDVGAGWEAVEDQIFQELDDGGTDLSEYSDEVIEGLVRRDQIYISDEDDDGYPQYSRTCVECENLRLSLQGAPPCARCSV
jgi:hypothetical protein